VLLGACAPGMSVKRMPSVSRWRPSIVMTYEGGIIDRSTDTTSTFLADPSLSRYQHTEPFSICTGFAGVGDAAPACASVLLELRP